MAFWAVNRLATKTPFAVEVANGYRLIAILHLSDYFFVLSPVYLHGKIIRISLMETVIV